MPASAAADAGHPRRARRQAGSPSRTYQDRVAVCDGDARLPHWWQLWSQERRLSCSVVVGNIHDLVTSLVSNNVDLMICYHHAQQPIHLDPERYGRVILGTELLRPYASQALVTKGARRCPADVASGAASDVLAGRLSCAPGRSDPGEYTGFRPADDRKRHVRRAVRDGVRRPWHRLAAREHRGGVRPQGADGGRRRQMGAPSVNGRL